MITVSSSSSLIFDKDFISLNDFTNFWPGLALDTIFFSGKEISALLIKSSIILLA